MFGIAAYGVFGAAILLFLALPRVGDRGLPLLALGGAAALLAAHPRRVRD